MRIKHNQSIEPRQIGSIKYIPKSSPHALTGSPQKNRIRLPKLSVRPPSSCPPMLNTPFLKKLSLHARHALQESRDIATYSKSKTIEPRHLLLAIFLENGSLGSFLLDNIGFEKEQLGKICLKHKKSERLPVRFVPLLSPATAAILRNAYQLAHTRSFPYVGTEHIVSALMNSGDEDIRLVATAFDIDLSKATSSLENHLRFEHFPELPGLFETSEHILSKPSTKKQSKTPSLDQFATDITDQDDPGILVGRETEIDRLITILSRRTKNNPLLIGEPGVGKTALVAELAHRIARGTAPPSLLDKRILSLDLALVVAGTNFRGEFETRLKDIMTEMKARPDIILFIDEIHTLVGAGNANGSLDAANILKPALARGEIRCIGATTFTEYKRHIEKDAALERRFQPLIIREPTAEETFAILETSKSLYETHHRVILPSKIVELIVNLAARSVPDRFFPDKAFDILDEAATRAGMTSKNHLKQETERSLLLRQHQDASSVKERLVKEGHFDDAFTWHQEERQLGERLKTLTETNKNHRALSVPVTETHVYMAVSRMTGIPLDKLSGIAPSRKLASLKRTLAQELVGQSDISKVITRSLARSISGIHFPSRPLGSFLLLGPTGVGKTHLAKILAQEYFGNERNLIRIDMSEFMEKHSVAQMIGSPAGYVGYGDGGKLTERIRRNPSSVVLFDEIEKAHPDVLNILLQILDEGVLTDAEGRQVSFKNALILITSNIGTAAFTQTAAIGFKKHLGMEDLDAQFENIRHAVLADLKKTLRPELFARIGETLIFRPLNQRALETIAQLELDALTKRLKEKNVFLTCTKEVAPFLAKRSFSPEHGARLIRRNIEILVEYPLAETLIKNRSTHITLSLRHNALMCHAS